MTNKLLFIIIGAALFFGGCAEKEAPVKYLDDEEIAAIEAQYDRDFKEIERLSKETDAQLDEMRIDEIDDIEEIDEMDSVADVEDGVDEPR